MAGQPLDQFTTLMASSSPAWMRGPEVIINEAVRTSYTGNRIAANGNMMEMVQGGTSIKDKIFLEEQSDYARYDVGEEFTYPHPETGLDWEVPWAFAKASISWHKQEPGLNVEHMGPKYRTQMYKKLMWEKWQNLWTAICNGKEAEFWARPHYDKMEASTGVSQRQPYSIPCSVNEFEFGVPNEIVDAGGDQWTTFQQVTRQAGGTAEYNPKFKCYSVGGGHNAAAQSSGYTYDETTSTMPWGVMPLFKVFSKAWWNLRFDQLPMKKEFSDKTSSPNVIWCSINGIILVENSLRSSNDYLRGMGKAAGNDPAYPGPTFMGTPIEVISALDTALLYSDGVQAVDENGQIAGGTSAATTTSIIGPRYYFINNKYLKFITHESNYGTLTPPMTPSKQPHTRVQVWDSWDNTINRAPRRHGIVGPASDVTYA